MNVGLLRAYTFTNLNLIHGETYFGIVKAIDTAGHESAAVFSPEQLVDSTPPGFTCASMHQLPIDVSYKVTDGDLSVFFNSTFVKDSLYHIRGSIRDAKYDLYPVLTINRHRELASLQRGHDGLFQYQFSFISPITGMQFVEIEFGPHVVEAMLQNVSIEECNMLPANNTNAVSIKQIGPYSIAVNLLIMDKESEIRTVRNSFHLY
ncbi:hypothetical protein DPMN_068312 [Dreissena polymorpha]|uniref:Uncharacterized protein n=1 Tax=Dreissena polymorpha TaxID=45954 RepID=A0A9D3YXF7_DREPO|nr:hypothetical protein DPMN_068312 [Dreissena polymorpha]